MSSKSRVWLDVLGEEHLWGEAPELNLALGSCKVSAFELHWHIMLQNIYILKIILSEHGAVIKIPTVGSPFN